MLTDLSQVESIVFDLDGTLYNSPGLAEEIAATARRLVASARGVSRARAEELLDCSRRRLSELLEEEPTLTRTCLELGIETRDFHRALQEQVHPEQYLAYDPILYALLDSLRDHCRLYLYTNNNLAVTNKILSLLGVEDLFQRLYTIEFSWQPKPDPGTFERLLEDIGGTPGSFLFVGDRIPVDLKLPDAMGIPTLQIRDVSELLQIHKLMHIIP